MTCVVIEYFKYLPQRHRAHRVKANCFSHFKLTLWPLCLCGEKISEIIPRTPVVLSFVAQLIFYFQRLPDIGLQIAQPLSCSELHE
jgi:hypothetical protein